MKMHTFTKNHHFTEIPSFSRNPLILLKMHFSAQKLIFSEKGQKYLHISLCFIGKTRFGPEMCTF